MEMKKENEYDTTRTVGKFHKKIFVGKLLTRSIRLHPFAPLGPQKFITKLGGFDEKSILFKFSKCFNFFEILGHERIVEFVDLVKSFPTSI